MVGHVFLDRFAGMFCTVYTDTISRCRTQCAAYEKYWKMVTEEVYVTFSNNMYCWYHTIHDHIQHSMAI